MSGNALRPWQTPPQSPERLGPQPHEGLVWHYTGRSGFAGIVSTHTVWATATDSLNDTGEGKFGVDDLLRYWEEVRPNLKPEAPAEEVDAWIRAATARLGRTETFVVCGCNHADSLVHWRSYIGDDKTQGYAIGFRPESEFRALVPNVDPALYLPDFAPAMYWREVTYGSHTDWEHRSNYWDRYKRLINDALDWLDWVRKDERRDLAQHQDLFDRALFTAVLTTKHEAYRSEDEARLVVLGAPGLTNERAGVYGPQRIITLTGDGDQNWDSYSTPTVAALPIAKVMLGPWNAPDDVDRVSGFLRAQGYDAMVERSAIPIR